MGTRVSQRRVTAGWSNTAYRLMILTIMAVYLDDEPVTLDGGDLASVLVAAGDRLAPSKRIVVEVHMDGHPVTSGTMDQWEKTSLADREVRLYSADPRQLASTTLQQIKTRLEEARQSQAQAAELLQADKLDEAMEQLGSAIEVWLQSQQAVLGSAGLLGIDLQNKDINGMSAKQITKAMIDKLTVMRDMLTNNDTVGLADVLAYELPETIDRWEQLIDAFITDRIKQ